MTGNGRQAAFPALVALNLKSLTYPDPKGQFRLSVCLYRASGQALAWQHRTGRAQGGYLPNAITRANRSSTGTM